MNKKEILISQIKEAFHNVTLENGIGLREAEGIDDYADAKTRKELRAMDEKRNWGNISSSTLNEYNSSLSYFDSKGMRFHLPSFMIAELKGEYLDSVVFHLVNNSDSSKARFSALSNSQREVIKQFLEYLLEDDEYGYERNQIKYAIDNYWKI